MPLQVKAQMNKIHYHAHKCIHAKVDVRSKDQSSLKVIRSEIKSLKNKTNKLNSIAYDQAQSIENLVNEKLNFLKQINAYIINLMIFKKIMMNK